MKRSVLLLGLLLPFSLHAQVRDSSAFRATQLIAPGVLVGSGLAVHCWGHETIDAGVKDWFYDDLRKGGERREVHADDYIQYVPVAMDLGLGMCGVHARHALLDRTIECAIAHVSLGAMSWGSKYLFHTLRPNGSNYKSFPSGHTNLTFAGAELVRMEYGAWWGGSAYVMGTAVGVMRMYNNWHWLSDVVAGAGLGILSAHIGGWLLEPVKNLFHIPDVAWDGFGTRCHKMQIAALPVADPLSGTYDLSIAVVF